MQAIDVTEILNLDPLQKKCHICVNTGSFEVTTEADSNDHSRLQTSNAVNESLLA